MIRLLEPWRSRLLWLSLGLNLFAAAALVAPHVWHRRPPGPPGFEPLIDRMARNLPAPDAEAFRAAMEREHASFEANRARVDQARSDVARSMARTPFDPAAAKAALQTMQDRLRDVSGQFDQSLVDALATLSPEARTALAANVFRGRR